MSDANQCTNKSRRHLTQASEQKCPVHRRSATHVPSLPMPTPPGMRFAPASTSERESDLPIHTPDEFGKGVPLLGHHNIGFANITAKDIGDVLARGEGTIFDRCTFQGSMSGSRPSIVDVEFRNCVAYTRRPTKSVFGEGAVVNGLLVVAKEDGMLYDVHHLVEFATGSRGNHISAEATGMGHVSLAAQTGSQVRNVTGMSSLVVGQGGSLHVSDPEDVRVTIVGPQRTKRGGTRREALEDTEVSAHLHLDGGGGAFITIPDEGTVDVDSRRLDRVVVVKEKRGANAQIQIENVDRGVEARHRLEMSKDWHGELRLDARNEAAWDYLKKVNAVVIDSPRGHVSVDEDQLRIALALHENPA